MNELEGFKRTEIALGRLDLATKALLDRTSKHTTYSTATAPSADGASIVVDVKPGPPKETPVDDVVKDPGTAPQNNQTAKPPVSTEPAQRRVQDSSPPVGRQTNEAGDQGKVQDSTDPAIQGFPRRPAPLLSAFRRLLGAITNRLAGR